MILTFNSILLLAEELIPVVSISNNGLADRKMCYLGSSNSVFKIIPGNKYWSYNFILILSYNSGSPEVAVLIFASRIDLNNKIRYLIKENIIVREDSDGNVYVTSKRENNYNINLSLLCCSGEPDFSISNISKEEFESIDTTDVQTF